MLLIFFFFNNTATTEIYTLSLHDALPISVKLLLYALEFLNKNDYTRYIYSPKIDELFMARQHDKAMADNTHKTISIHDTIKESDFIQFEDIDLSIEGNVTIDTLSIKESDGRIPTYEVTLDRKSVV